MGKQWHACTNGLAEVGFGLLHGCSNAGPSRRNRRSIEKKIVKLDNRLNKKRKAKK